jgi:hypothetical protein
VANTNWQISGDYFESCNCDYLCPCITSNMTAPPTKGDCVGALVLHIDQGRYDNMALDGLSFAVVLHASEELVKGNWSVGVITDSRATPEQQQALTEIASGQAGGPMAMMAPLIGTFLGVEAKPIHFEKKGTSRSVSIPGVLDEAIEGVAGGANPAEPLYLDNTLHPANPRLALAKAVRSHLHVFGIDWDDDSGRNNGHFAPFNWKG